ncbi:Hsp33 family molecular chaperone HslO [Luteimonas sp. WGS1318]|uniref:Hsp33 family molecular chaperone HslO n=1 Tax=Luteimonas sp. WGS1318 TaxID=3366815 RepID=UPI00372D5899
MTEHFAPDTDRLSRFLLPHAGVRGVRVHLTEAWRQVRANGPYPPAIEEMLGEACAAAALFTGHAKVDGRLSVQLRAPGALRTLFAECTAAGTIRGIARFDADLAASMTRDLRDLGDGALLALTIENPSRGREPMRYQGLVSLDSATLSGAFEDYFRQSEQLPTRVLLAVDGGHAAGLMVQRLPGDEGDADGWNRISTLFDTLSTTELLRWPNEVLLTRLFSEDEPQLLGERLLEFGCSCSRERVEAMIASLGPDEARASVVDGEVHVVCEFCGQDYRFSPDEVETMLRTAADAVASPERMQ